MATFTVTTSADEVGANGQTSLREALALAEAHAGADRIELAQGLGSGGQARVELRLGQLEITQAGGPLTLDGDTNDDGVADLVIDAGGRSRVVQITGTAGDRAEVAIEGVEITGEKVVGTGYAVARSGGGLQASDADLTLVQVASSITRSARKSRPVVAARSRTAVWTRRPARSPATALVGISLRAEAVCTRVTAKRTSTR